MKKILLTFILIIFLIPQVSFGALATDLQGCWDMDESSGTRADSSPNGNTLADNNTVGSATGIISNGADHIRANSEFLSITDASQTGLDFGAGDFSISAWIKRSSTGSSGRFGGIFNKIVANDSVGFRFGISNDKFNAYRSNTTSTDINSTNTFTDTGVFYHAVMVVNGVNVKIFVDTVEEASGGSTDFNVDNTEQASTGRLRNSDFHYLDAIIDELAVWSKALTTDEISELFNSGSAISCATIAADVEAVEVEVSDLWIDFSMIWDGFKSFWNNLT